MDSYKEYPIRCKTCNEQLACLAEEYEALVSASSIEEALNDLGLTCPHSRIAMMNPTIVTFNMENREVIEGFKSVEAADEIDAENNSFSQPVFPHCIKENIIGLKPCIGDALPVTINPVLPTTNVLPPIRSPALGVGLETTPSKSAARLGLAQIGKVQPSGRIKSISRPVAVEGPIQALVKDIPPILPQSQLVPSLIPGFGPESEAFGEGLPVEGTEKVGEQFQTPTIVGFPTWNKDPLIPEASIHVGFVSNKPVYCQVLNGRTHLAQ